MKWKRIKCFLTGGHRLYDKNLQTIHDTNGYKGDKGECFCKDFFQIGVF